jgi:hypothetical protein
MFGIMKMQFLIFFYNELYVVQATFIVSGVQIDYFPSDLECGQTLINLHVALYFQIF